MQLLYGSSVPVPQFASLSLLLAEGMAEPLTAVAPNATCSTQAATLVVEDLHSHVRSIIQSSKSSTNGSMDFASELLREEEPSLVTTQIFRSGAGNGIGLHFRFLRGNSDNNLLQALVLDLIKSSPGKIDPATRVLGVLICVAVSGWGMIHCTASIPYSLSQRIDDCIQYLTSTSRHCDLIMAKSLLTVFLLTQDDHRISTKMMEAPNLLVFPGSDDRSRGLLSPLGMISPIAEFGRTARRASTGIVRGVISAGAGIGGAHTNSLSQADSGAATQADSSIPVRMDPTSSDSARCMTEKLTLLSVSESATILRRYTNTGRERMANLDLTSGTKSRFRRRKADIRVADFDQFDFKGPAKQSIAQRENKAIPAPLLTPEVVPGKLQLKSSSKDTKRGVPGTRRMSTHSNNRDEESAHRPMHSPKGDSGDPLNQKKIQKTQFDDETYDSRSHSGNYDANSVMSQDRMQVSIALNEDMTCSYKLSQLSSCVVEGVVQAQVKSTVRPNVIPFSLLVRDVSTQLDTLHENKKFAEKETASIQHNQKKSSDQRFKVTLPKHETYFPLFKYTCTGDLRPVPIRVQSKVKYDAGFCRVALQISSNPNNDANLSDLTIVMGVPDGVLGDTLATQPAGGVWDESKSTVVWCVSDLGSGEKFQLQARFETETDTIPARDMNFPVLVRCQCLHMQLSDIEFEVSDSRGGAPTEMIMKVARRYRLSHREKNG